MENCSKCSAGKYAIVEGAASETACLNCEPGRYQTAVGANHVSLCLACSPGKTANDPGRTADCIVCPTGWYMDKPAQTTDCKICNQGFAQSEETSISCEPCLPGLFQSAMGQDNCIECDAGGCPETNTGIPDSVANGARRAGGIMTSAACFILVAIGPRVQGL